MRVLAGDKGFRGDEVFTGDEGFAGDEDFAGTSKRISHDAVLLAEAAQAEAARLTPRLLHDVFRRDREPGDTASTDPAPPLSPTVPVTTPGSMSVDRKVDRKVDSKMDSKVDWEGFHAEYPRVRGTAEEWLERLSRALEAVVVEAIAADTDRPLGSLPDDAHAR